MSKNWKILIYVVVGVFVALYLYAIFTPGLKEQFGTIEVGATLVGVIALVYNLKNKSLDTVMQTGGPNAEVAQLATKLIKACIIFAAILIGGLLLFMVLT